MVGRKSVAGASQFLAQLHVVVDLAVEDYGEGSVLVEYRLLPGIYVDDGETTRSERHSRSFPISLGVRTAVTQALGHRFQDSSMMWPGEASYAAHCGSVANVEESDCKTHSPSHCVSKQVYARAQRILVTTLVVLQPGYLPWLGYFDLLKKADIFVHYDDVQFDKHGWRNRNRVKGPKGAAWLTVPVLHSGRAGQSILDVQIDNHQSWRRKHLSTIGQLYARAPFREVVLPQLQEILERPWGRLVDLDLAIIDWLAAELDIETPRYRSSELGIGGERNERLLNLCRHFGATRYLSGNAAQEYFDVALFAAAHIEVTWHDYVHPTYAQLHGTFVPYLSVLDLLLNTGSEARRIISQ
jgi:hypothetical protein